MAKRLLGRKIKVLVRTSWFNQRPVKVIAGFLAIVLLVMYPLLRGKKTEAEVISLFASSCSGGWENTQEAAGPPDISENSIEKYSDLNSASISNASAPIVCSGFKGEIPKDLIQ